MKASFSPTGLVFAIFCAAVILPASASGVDTLILTNGQRREGEILGVANDRVRFKAGPVETALPLDQVEAARMEPPAKFEQALEAWQNGDAAATLQVLKPLVENFNGLPAPWVQRAAALMGTVLIEAGDIDAARAAFEQFQSTYPDAQGLAELGLARLAIEDGDLDAAETRLMPIVSEAKETLAAESSKSSEYGQALYLHGTILEKRGNLPDAMENYMLTTTIFYEDAAAATKARKRATELSEEKNTKVP
jgi:predicted Zn-dependent protease